MYNTTVRLDSDGFFSLVQKISVLDLRYVFSKHYYFLFQDCFSFLMPWNLDEYDW